MEEEKSNIIKAITAPLGFFALSLLIVEGFLGITLGLVKTENQYFYFTGMIIGATLFLIVVLIVWHLVLRHPKNIVLAGKDYTEIEKIRSENKDNQLKEMDLKVGGTLPGAKVPAGDQIDF